MMAGCSVGCLRLLVLASVLIIATADLLDRLSTSQSVSPIYCRHRSCFKASPYMLNVHIVPHSHDDVGWLKTVDQYYYGSNTKRQRAGVQYILDTVFNELWNDPQKRFIQVETSFFKRWYEKQSAERQKLVGTLVRTGGLEFTGGAWSMNDEAATNYQSTIDQFTWGYRFLNDTFGFCGNPRVAWQIDPFGHSRGFATLVAQMGLDGLFLGRVDHEDKAERLRNHTSEMVWKTSPNLGKKAELLTGVLYNRYSAPPDFCFDDQCRDEPIIDDPESPDYNVDKKVSDFINYIEKQAANYTGSHIMLTMGGDFNFQSATTWYTNLDKLIRYVNAKQTNGSRINAFYSTPACYLQGLNLSNIVWTTKEDDFFPYSSDDHSFWAGYFTSRPTHKYMERLGNNLLQVSKQLSALAVLQPEDNADITTLREAMGIVQHHDAITGTEKQHVADDYARILTKGMFRAANAAEKALQKLTNRTSFDARSEAAPAPPQFRTCLMLNISQCEPTETLKRFVVTVYNPLGQQGKPRVRIPVQKGKYSVLDPQGKSQKFQMLPVPKSVLTIPGRKSPATVEIVFYAMNLPPFGFRSYFVEKTGDVLEEDGNLKPVNSFTIGSEESVSVEVNSETGLLKKITTGGKVLPIESGYYYYNAFAGNNQGASQRSSGAYIFRPNGPAEPVSLKANVEVYKGELVEEIHQVYSDWVSQVIRTYPKEQTVEFSWQVGPIPIDDGQGKEIINRFETPLKSKGIFYTDSNGRELIQRQRNSRPSYTAHLKEEIAGNYYPVNSQISIRDAEKNQSFFVLVDRSQGGSSLEDGQIEVMLHRRLLHDDAKGVSEPLNETAFGKGLVARGDYVLFSGEENPTVSPSVSAKARILARQILLKPWLFFSDATNVPFADWQKNYVMEWAGLNSSLPNNVHLLTLEPWRKNELLLRLEHPFEKNEDPVLSKPAEVSLKTLLKPYKVHSANETYLAANLYLNQYNRTEWKTDSADFTDEESKSEYDLNIEKITLNPMEIRTFLLNVTSN